MVRIIGSTRRRDIVIGGTALLASPALAQSRPIVVASKIDTEGGLLGQMIVLLLEKDGMRVENRVPLGPTRIVRTAILKDGALVQCGSLTIFQGLKDYSHSPLTVLFREGYQELLKGQKRRPGGADQVHRVTL